MKFKKSHILLISLISLFLLLSMSAVSAASDVDNLAQDLVIDDVSEMGDIDNVDNDIIDANVLSEGDPEAVGDGNTNPDDPETGENGGESGETGTISIEASNENYAFGDNLTINVSVKDSQGNPIDITKDDLLVSSKKEGEENFTVMNFTYNNETKNIKLVFEPKKTLSVGNYIVNIIFNKTIGDIPYFNETNLTLNIRKSETTLNASDIIKVHLGNKTIIIPINLTLESNKTLDINRNNITVYLLDGEGNVISNFTCTNETGGLNVTTGIRLLNFNLTDVSDLGNHDLLIVFSGTDNCDSSNKTITLRILENNTINANSTINVNNSTKEVIIPFNVTNTRITNTTGEDGEIVTNVNVTNLTDLEGNLALILKYFNQSSNATEEIPITDFILVSPGEDGGNYTINFTLPDLSFNKDFYKLELVLIYKNDTLNETNRTINLKVFAEAHIVVVEGYSVADYQFGEFKFRLLDENNNPLPNHNVTISGLTFYDSIGSGYVIISTTRTATSDDEGYIIINNTFISNDLRSLAVGAYNVTFNGTGFLALNNTTEITVVPINVKIIEAYNVTDEFGKIINYTFQVVRAETNEPINQASVQFKIVSSNINAVRNSTTNSTGWYTSPALNLTGGTYNITLNVIDSNLNCTTKNLKKFLIITPRKATLTASNRTIYYNSDYSAIVRLTDKKTGKAVANAILWLRVYTGSKYSDFIGRTNKDGKLYLSTPLAVGKHKIIYQTLDSNYNASKITRYLTVKKASAKFAASSVSTYYKSGKNFQIKLTNAKTKKAMYFSKMNIKVFISKLKYYNYTGTTDGNGLVKFKISYKPGTYKVVISNFDKGYSASAINRQIKVSKSPIKMAPTSLKVKKGSYFKVKVTSTKSKKVLSGVKVKVKVYTGKKYKTYTIKTNKKGIASLKISQKIGKHKVVLSPGSPAYYSAKALTKTLTVTK